MSTPQGAQVAPFQASNALSGNVVDAKSHVVHEFLNVLRTLVRDGGAFRHEHEVHEALRTIDSYSRAHLASDHLRVIGETDLAPVEDVRLRRPAVDLPQQPGLGIDYKLLARAIIQAQMEAQGQPVPTGPAHVITDAGQSGPSAEEAANAQPS